MKRRPEEIIILGLHYTIEYVDRPSDVDINKRESLWGQIDYWTRSIRVYDNGRRDEDVWETILHEVIHAIADVLKLGDIGEDETALLSLGLADVLFRNGIISLDDYGGGIDEIEQ